MGNTSQQLPLNLFLKLYGKIITITVNGAKTSPADMDN